MPEHCPATGTGICWGGGVIESKGPGAAAALGDAALAVGDPTGPEKPGILFRPVPATLGHFGGGTKRTQTTAMPYTKCCAGNPAVVRQVWKTTADSFEFARPGARSG